MHIVITANVPTCHKNELKNFTKELAQNWVNSCHKWKIHVLKPNNILLHLTQEIFFLMLMNLPPCKIYSYIENENHVVWYPKIRKMSFGNSHVYKTVVPTRVVEDVK